MPPERISLYLWPFTYSVAQSCQEKEEDGSSGVHSQSHKRPFVASMMVTWPVCRPKPLRGHLPARETLPVPAVTAQSLMTPQTVSWHPGTFINPDFELAVNWERAQWCRCLSVWRRPASFYLEVRSSIPLGELNFCTSAPEPRVKLKWVFVARVSRPMEAL